MHREVGKKNPTIKLTDVLGCVQARQEALTGTQRPLVAQAVEVVALAEFAPHLSKLVGVARALAAQTVASATAQGAAHLRDAVGVVGRAVVLH